MKGTKNLRGPPILSEEARGYFTVPVVEVLLNIAHFESLWVAADMLRVHIACPGKSKTT